MYAPVEEFAATFPTIGGCDEVGNLGSTFSHQDLVDLGDNRHSNKEHFMLRRVAEFEKRQTRRQHNYKMKNNSFLI